MRAHLLTRCLPAAVAAAVTVFTITPSATAAIQWQTSSGLLRQGAYQSAYSDKNDSLWVATASNGSGVSELLKVDPETLEVTQAITPPTGADGKLQMLFGVDVDDSTNTVWVTNTRINSVSVYSQSDGAHLATIAGVTHSRDVVVDEQNSVAYVSAVMGKEIVKIDTKTYQVIERIPVDGQPMGLDFDEATGTLVTSTLDTNKAVVIRGQAQQSYPLAATRASGVAYDAPRDRVYVASQESADLTVVNASTGEVIKTIPAGAGALTVDQVGDLIMVGNLMASTLTVVDANTLEVVDTITHARPNHVAAAKGSFYVVDKSAAGPNNTDSITRFTPPADPSNPSGPVSSDGVKIDVTVEAPAGDGALTMTVAGDQVNLGSGTMKGDRISYTGTLPEVTVTDQRSEAKAAGGGWSVAGRTGDFSSGSSTFEGKLLGWTPTTPQAKPGLTLGSSVASGFSGGVGLSESATLASATGTARQGSTALGADLALDVPVDTPAGSYVATATVSLFPTD